MNKPAAKPKLPTMHPVKSTSLASIGHEGDVLTVRFANGGTYLYAGVTTAQFHQLRDAKSVGSHFQAEIRTKFTGKSIK